ncbi:MAG: Ig-like domain-containing protein, partial [Lachnospiraceae bacterium]|nr:Ig-like domain-containing protein [Lachnospiraceae bacterium]
MKRKWCRALGIILSVCMLSGDLGTIAVSAAGDPAAVSAEAAEEADTGEETDAPDEGTEAAEDEAGQKEGEPAEETPAEGGEAVSENDAETEEGSEEESASENEAEKEEASEGESASENEAEEGESASENEAEEGESASENEAEEGVSDEETVSVNEAEEAEEETDDGTGEYLVEEYSHYTVKGAKVTPGSYSATAVLTLESSEYYYDDYDYAVLYTTKTDADFFPGSVSVSGNLIDDSEDYKITYFSDDRDYDYVYDDDNNFLGCVYTYNLDIPNRDSDDILTPDTQYTYRIVRRGTYHSYSYVDGNYVPGYYDYNFVTVPASFTTGPEVTTPTVSVKNYEVNTGYYEAGVKVRLNNPDNNIIDCVKLATKNIAEGEEGYWSTTLYFTYSWEDDGKDEYYYGDFLTGKGDLEILIGVRTGKDGAIKYVKSDLSFEKHDIKDAKASISVNCVPEQFKISASAALTPGYEIDDMDLILYYKKKDYPYFSSTYGNRQDDGSYKVTSFLSEGETEYDYYLVFRIYDGNEYVVLASEGSKEEPKSFKTDKLVTYTKEDFKDPGLYAYVSSNYGTITNATLSGKTYLSIYSIYDNTPIKSLEDIPDKFPSITELHIQGHDITDIAPLLECKYLEEVNLNYNDIATLPDLSAVTWTRLYLDYNKLSKGAIAAAKLPSRLAEYADDWDMRKDVLNTADTYYIDSNGVYPLIIEWLGRKSGRSYTVTISVGDTTKNYSMNSTMLVNKTGNVDFGFEKDKSYTANITINDGFNDVFTGERSFTFKAMPCDVEDYYTVSSVGEVNPQLYLPIEYKKDYTRAELVKDGKVYMKSNYVSSYTTSRNLYDGVFEYGIGGLSYQYFYMYTYMYTTRILTEGDYDLYFYSLKAKENESDPDVEDDPLIFAKKVHVVAAPIVESISLYPSYVDQAGDYFYIQLHGYYLDEKTYPSITDGKGNSFTKYVSYKHDGTGSFVYKLQKQNWDTINKSADDTVYYVSLNGDPTDRTSDADKKVYASDLKKATAVNLEPVSAFYNWKQSVFEFTFDSTVAKGSSVTVEFLDEKDNTQKKAEGSATVGDKGHTVISPKSLSDNSIYIPTNDTWVDVRIVCGDSSIYTDINVCWYNYYGPNEPSQESRLSLSLSKRYLAAPAESIDVYLYASDDRHKTEDISARLLDKNKNVLDTVKLTCTKGDNYNTYKKEAWKFANALAEGSYKIEAYETVDGKDVVLSSSNLYVRNKDNFYASYANGWFLSDDATKATFEVDIAVQDIPQTSKEAELNQLVKDLGLKIEVFDEDYKPVTVTVKPTSASSYGYVYFEISGLDKDAYCYYARITSKGKTPLDPNTDKEYYTDKDHGRMFNRSSYNLWVEDSSTLNAYYYIYFGGYKAEENLPLAVSFYPLADRNTLVKSFTIGKGDLKSNIYMFTQNDVKELDAKTVYNCTISAKNQTVANYTGYFTYQHDSKPVPVTGVSISQGKTYSLAVGSTVQLTAVIAPSNANQYTGLSWSSSNAKVATVDASGLVTAVAEGKATITVKTENSKTATCAVTVTDGRIRVTGVKIAEGTSASVKPGETLQLTAEFTPADATEKGVTWSSSDTSVATVSDTGLVTATAKEGKSVISVKTTDGGFTASCVVKVASGIVKVSGIRINEGSSITLDPGAEKKLTYTIT